ncbi:hypothetical protein FF098_003885 [Parvularcula flava]|uniref:Tat pathway signal sequence domain protein n=1 Tax=Aquisalinus luteolus TaxID=1566827 RepID=A0A8J3A0S6_9PROT|nr:hypothetical protein [Aquisalinus luteolus]NHK27044.1 hypothetical protein [Aquisalinus luteolus]GGH94196.1 hypothetical protein GCM10011355_07810 [Aquisalinus luteolus]
MKTNQPTPNRRRYFHSFLAATALLGVSAASIALAPTAVAQITKAQIDGTYQAAEDPAIVNRFVVDIFGGLEVTPIRDGRNGQVVIYEKVSEGLWREAGPFLKNRATYTYTNSGAFLWQNRTGTKKYTLYRTGRDQVATDNYVIQGSYMLDGVRSNYNVFEMTDGDTVLITPYRNNRKGAAVTYKRSAPDEFRATNSAATYTVLPNGDLLWESNDSRNIRISLTPR